MMLILKNIEGPHAKVHNKAHDILDAVKQSNTNLVIKNVGEFKNNVDDFIAAINVMINKIG